MAAVVGEEMRNCYECGEVATLECSVCNNLLCKACAGKHFKEAKPIMIEIRREAPDANTNKKL
jgi:hypothetical protein